MNEAVISIIDDDKATLFALASLMQAKGYVARTYDSAEDFLDAGTYETSQCIITDIHMPGLSGIELKYRLDAVHCVTPVIMITARVEQRLHDLARISGVHCLLRKPFKADELIACVERAIVNWRLHDDLNPAPSQNAAH